MAQGIGNRQHHTGARAEHRQGRQDQKKSVTGHASLHIEGELLWPSGWRGSGTLTNALIAAPM
ncbi:hypothetical protein D3C76_1808420 [compost metagenome]